MIIENPKLLNSKDIYDVVIIGAGPAGISLALDLAEKKIKCCLLEAGGLEFSENSQDIYKTSFTENFPNDLEYSRLRMFGGSTGHWGGTCRTLDEYDFVNWPIKKKELNPYLSKSLSYLNIKDEFKERNISNDIKLVEFRNSNIKFGDNYLDKIKSSNYINLVLNAYVFNFTQEKNKIKKIKFFYKEKEKINIKGKVFVFALGGVENSRILLYFNDLEKNIFNKNLPIGNYWFEHPYTKFGECLLNKKKIEKYESMHSIQYAFGSSKDSRTLNFSPTYRFIKEKQILNSSIFLTYEKTNNDVKGLIKNLSCYAPKISKTIFSMFEKGLICNGILRSSWEQDSEYDNCIKIDQNNKDKFNIPKVKLNYKLSYKSQHTGRTFLKKLSDYFIANDLGRIKAESYMLDTDQEIVSEAGYHHMGGTIMGNNEKHSVVDKDLKIHGSKNCFVIGSSVFPSGGHANPTLTILQLSFRLSDNISDLLKKI